MSEVLTELVSRMPRLRSPETRLLLYALAHLADDEGDCRVVPFRRLEEATQLRTESVRQLLIHLEAHLRLVVRSEHCDYESSRMQLQVDRLRNPAANQPPETHTHKVLGGPLDGTYTAPPAEDGKTTMVTFRCGRLASYAQRPVLYRPADRHGPGTTHVDGLRYEPAVLTVRADDGIEHVYRLSSRTWLYSGTTLTALVAYTKSHRAVSLLRAVDIVSIEEFDNAMRTWHQRRGDRSPAALAAHLHQTSYHLYYPDHQPVLSGAVAANLLRAHESWTQDLER